MSQVSSLKKLAAWYEAQCDGDWEHGFGFSITTLDNPGVALDITLTGTSLETTDFAEKKDFFESASRWMVCRRTAKRFEGRGAPSRLEDIVDEFLAWAEANAPIR